jgi:hypothetical protein
MLKYHGTPITPRATLMELAGKNFCVSYAAPGDIAWCDDHAQSLMLDNGAFSAWTQGRAVDWTGYYAWCEQWLDRLTTWAVIPDVIDGDAEANDALLKQWPYGDRGAPVWHMHEPLGRLLRLIDDWPLVCIGSSAQYATLGSPTWTYRMNEAWDCVHDRKPRLHMLRGLDYVDGPYPFYSADSTNVARNHAGNNQGRPRRAARLMADLIDSRNPARRWVPTPEQMGLVA